MALNFSYRPIFPGGLSEDNLVSSMGMGNGYRVDGITEKSSSGGSDDGFGNGWHAVDNSFDYGGDRCDRGTTTSTAHDSVSKDIIDRLPLDPFGMDINSTITAFTELLQDFNLNYGGYCWDEVGTSGENFPFYAEWNLILNNTMRFSTFPQGGNASIEEKNFRGVSGFGECSQREVGEASFASGSSSDMDGVLGLGCDYRDVAIAGVSGDINMVDVNYLEGDDLSPHPALSFSLSYLGLSDLLVVERVCKSLHSNVRGDPLLWRSIHIEQPLSEKITDEILLELTSRAQGNVQCLSLVDCNRITDDGLRRVLEVNPKIIKLMVPGCTRLSIDGIVGMLKAYNSRGTQRLKQLHIGGLYGVTPEKFEDIKLLLGTDSQLQEHSHKPHFYCRWNLYLPCDDDRSLDIEVCPRCQSLRLIYDCPAEGCQEKAGHTTQACRACTLCIPRCSRCGCCINDSEYEETFCLELLCSSCSQHLARMDGEVGEVSSVLPGQS